MNDIQIFNYKENPVTFQVGNTDIMINATEMAKPFGKQPSDWLRLKSTEEFLTALASVRGIPRTDMLLKIQGGGIQGTWMHEDVALEFARWLSPAFAIWCNDRIKELLKNGSTELPSNGYAMQLPKTYSEALRQLADAVEAKEKVQLQLAAKTEQLDESKDWYSIKRWAKEHGMNWRKVSWRALKAISAEHGLGVKKIFDGNYGEVNIYHRKAFAILYGK